ncbi:MAG TPA: response regulator transcription factor [Solirubrobacteraceae bacterium]|nr:response regulator transcription factor [Solirubrobacteraceae bacterium]
MLVVDDHEVVRWGFRLLLGGQSWVERCLGAQDAEEAIALAHRYDPHVALVDLFLGGESGADVALRLREASPRTRVLLLSGAGRISERAARAAGASGFVLKDQPAREICAAVRAVAAGGNAFAAPEAADGAAEERLTTRERDVLELLAAGATNREIAERLVLSPHTVKEHTSALYRKLGVRNRAEAARRAHELGLAD